MMLLTANRIPAPADLLHLIFIFVLVHQRADVLYRLLRLLQLTKTHESNSPGLTSQLYLVRSYLAESIIVIIEGERFTRAVPEVFLICSALHLLTTTTI